MAWAVGPLLGATKAIDRVPPAPRATVTALARSSPTGRLRVELPGLLVATGPMEKQPLLIWPVTVRLPVTAIAPAGTPLTVKVRAAWLVNGPDRPPVPLRVSRTRFGLF